LNAPRKAMVSVLFGLLVSITVADILQNETIFFRFDLLSFRIYVGEGFVCEKGLQKS
jgi:hypothetical protein